MTAPADSWPPTRVILSRRWPEPVEDYLAQRCDLVRREDDVPMSVDEFTAALADCDVLCPTVTDVLPAEIFKPGQRARLIANFGAGVNHLPLKAIAASGKLISNTPDVLTDCTADLAMMLILMSARLAGVGERELRAGQWHGWRPTHLLGTKVTGKRLGIVGMGRIGQALAQRAQHGFGMQVGYFNRSTLAKPPAGTVAYDSLDALLSDSEFVSLHCPATEQTRHLLDDARIAKMPRGSYLINTSRGDVVDEQALVSALTTGQLAGAGLDVYQGEPAVNSALLEREDVVLLPHLGSATQETREAMGMRVVANIQNFLHSQPLTDPVT